MNKLAYYTIPLREQWSGRVDDLEDRDAFRWHQVVELLDLSIAPSQTGLKGYCLLGYRCERGVELNLGRTGAAMGPSAIRSQLANLPVNFSQSIGLYDAGDVYCKNGDLEGTQHTLSEAVRRILMSGLYPILMGGGHDIALGHYLGIKGFLPPSKRLGIINFDAHLDLRPLRPHATSGTMFTQIASDCRERGAPFSYCCIGAQKSANTISLFKIAEELGVETILAKEIDHANLEPIKQKIDTFLSKNDVIYLTICADVFSSAFAPGVSAPQPFGLPPDTVLYLLKHILGSGKTMSFDFAEVSPRFDSDDNTAKIAAIFIFALVDTMSQ